MLGTCTYDWFSRYKSLISGVYEPLMAKQILITVYITKGNLDTVVT